MNSTAASAKSRRFAIFGTRKTLNDYFVLSRVEEGNPPRNFSNVLLYAFCSSCGKFLRCLLLFPGNYLRELKRDGKLVGKSVASAKLGSEHLFEVEKSSLALSIETWVQVRQMPVLDLVPQTN